MVESDSSLDIDSSKLNFGLILEWDSRKRLSKRWAMTCLCYEVEYFAIVIDILGLLFTSMLNKLDKFGKIIENWFE